MVELGRDGMTVVTWVFTGAAIVLSSGRYAIRLKILKKPLKADDYVHGLALVFLVGYVSTYSLKYSWTAGAGLGEQLSDWFTIRHLHLEIAVLLLFWSVIYLVKTTFLLLYHSLFSIDETFMRIWWAVSVFTGVTFLINFTSVFWACEAPHHLFVLDHCFSKKALSIDHKLILMWCGLNVASSVSIIILPLWIIPRLQMPISRKLGLAALLMIAMSDVIFDVIRTKYTSSDVNKFYSIWGILEPTVAVIVSSLPTYKALLGGAKKARDTRHGNLGHNGRVVWHINSSNNANGTKGVELGKRSTRVPEAWPNSPLQRSTDTVQTTEIV